MSNFHRRIIFIHPFKVGLIYNRYKKQLSRDEALKKAMKYCAYQERCCTDMEGRLKDWGVSQKDIDKVVDDLVENDFINEKRYANSYARGKFMSNKWGRFKIRIHLRNKNIHEDEIEEALKKIDQSEYEKVARNLIQRKKQDLKEMDDRTASSKIYYFMVSKGYESDLIFKLLND